MYFFREKKRVLCNWKTHEKYVYISYTLIPSILYSYTNVALSVYILYAGPMVLLYSMEYYTWKNFKVCMRRRVYATCTYICACMCIYMHNTYNYFVDHNCFFTDIWRISDNRILQHTYISNCESTNN